jgi:c-di-GMP-binding flagellar brake protein YcgR
MTIEERRKYPRLVLKIEDGYFGKFKLTNNEKLIGAITNFSAGGLNLEVEAKIATGLNPGDRLLLTNIAGGTNLAFVSQIDATIRWINPSEKSGYLSIGMEFINLDASVEKQMAHFVRSERISRGQYD